MAKVGDVNADGIDDLAIGAYYDQQHNWGAVYVASSDDMRLLFRKLAPAQANYGIAVAPAGDSNSDGRADVAVGATFWSNDKGRVEVLTHAPAGVTPCMSQVNSTGLVAALSAFGSTAASANDLTLVAHNLPDGFLSFIIASRAQGFVPMPGQSQGNLCLGGSIARVWTTLDQTAAGQRIIPMDLTAIPEAPSYHVAVMPGETWHFQLWHRDQATAGFLSNFSDSLAVTFQ